MAIETGMPHAAATLWRFPAAVAGVLGFVRVILQSHRAVNELDALSDRYLRDIGVDRPQIAEVVKRELARNSLLETGRPRER